MPARSRFVHLNMDQALVLAPQGQVTVPPDPSSNLGAWLVLLLIFMLGMLFQACVPRLCQKGVAWGGKCLRRIKTCWRYWEQVGTKWRHRAPWASTRRDGMREPGTPTSTEPTPPRFLSLTEIRAPEHREPAEVKEQPSSSIRGPDFRQRPGRGTPKRTPLRTTSTHQSPVLGAMMAAASPRR